MDQPTTRIGRDRIVAIAEELFTERGYRAVSIRDIADACQVTNAALYYHFANKEALFHEVMERHTQKLADRMRKAGEINGTTRDRVTAILIEYSHITADRRSPMFLLRREVHSAQREHEWKDMAKLFHVMLQPLEDVLLEASQRGELRDFGEDFSPASVLVGMLHGMKQYHRMCLQSGLRDKDIPKVIDVFWNGIKT
jgi:AcrR family transcriptional regulator